MSQNLPNIYACLIHHDVLDKNGRTVNTAVTNLDIHDIARSARTYGLSGYFIANPQPEQHRVVARILEHWRTDAGAKYNPDRSEAFSRVHLVETMNQAVEAIQAENGGQQPQIVMTTARKVPNQAKFADFRRQLPEIAAPVLLCFGTGWGLKDEFLKKCDVLLEPIAPMAETDYNHLSVRSAAAIVFDRLLGNF